MFKPIDGFSCTGSDESHVWNELHGPILDKFHCGNCQRHAQSIFNGIHGFVSLGIGKKLTKQEYKDSFIKLYSEINLVYNQAVKDGRL